jgi:hypothetical protein
MLESKLNKVNGIKVLQGLNAIKKQEVLSTYTLNVQNAKLNLQQALMISK